MYVHGFVEYYTFFAGLDQVQNSSLPAHIHSLSASQQKVTLILILGSVGDLRSLKFWHLAMLIGEFLHKVPKLPQVLRDVWFVPIEL